MTRPGRSWGRYAWRPNKWGKKIKGEKADKDDSNLTNSGALNSLFEGKKIILLLWGPKNLNMSKYQIVKWFTSVFGFLGLPLSAPLLLPAAKPINPILSPFCLIGTYRGQKALKCSKIFIAVGVQLHSAHAGNTDWAKMSLGQVPTLPKGTPLNAMKNQKKLIIFADLAWTTESVQPMTRFPIHISKYMTQ